MPDTHLISKLQQFSSLKNQSSKQKITPKSPKKPAAKKAHTSIQPKRKSKVSPLDIETNKDESALLLGLKEPGQGHVWAKSTSPAMHTFVSTSKCL
jgi:hypothetical protein